MSGDLVPFRDIKDPSKPPKPPQPLTEYEKTCSTGWTPFDVVLLVVGALLWFGASYVVTALIK